MTLGLTRGSEKLPPPWQRRRASEGEAIVKERNTRIEKKKKVYIRDADAPTEVRIVYGLVGMKRALCETRFIMYTVQTYLYVISTKNNAGT